MELIRIRCTAATAIKSCEAILAFVLGIDIAKLEFFHDIVSFYTMEYITQFELLLSNKLMTRIQISSWCHCQILRTGTTSRQTLVHTRTTI